MFAIVPLFWLAYFVMAHYVIRFVKCKRNQLDKTADELCSHLKYYILQTIGAFLMQQMLAHLEKLFVFWVHPVTDDPPGPVQFLLMMIFTLHSFFLHFLSLLQLIVHSVADTNPRFSINGFRVNARPSVSKEEKLPFCASDINKRFKRVKVCFLNG